MFCRPWLFRRALVAVIFGLATVSLAVFDAQEAGASLTWSASPSPSTATVNDSQAPPFAAIACPNGGTCSAAGDYPVLDTDSSIPYFHGATYADADGWSGTSVPLPSGGVEDEVGISDLVCPSANVCVAVGYYQLSDGYQEGLILTWDGSTWTPTTAPLPGSSNGDIGLKSVDCPSTSWCVIAGSYWDTSDQTQGVILTGSGTSWTSTEVPMPSPSTGVTLEDLQSVSCTGVDACDAVGAVNVSAGYDGGSGAGYVGLITAIGGTQSTPTLSSIFAPPATEQRAVDLTSIACTAGATCAAIGYSGSTDDGIVLDGSGTSWTQSGLPLPSGASDVEPAAVTCVSTGTCVVAGESAQEPYLADNSRGSWRVDTVNLPDGSADAGGLLNAVACSSSTDCIAAGAYFTPGDQHEAPLIVDGAPSTTFVGSAAPLPTVVTSAFAYGVLTSVGCANADDCVASGWYAAPAEYNASVAIDQGLFENGVPADGSTTSGGGTSSSSPGSVTSSSSNNTSSSNQSTSSDVGSTTVAETVPTPVVGFTPTNDVLKPGVTSTTIVLKLTSLKVGTKLTVDEAEPGLKKLRVSSAKVISGHEVRFATGKLPVGTTELRFYESTTKTESVGKVKKVVTTEKLVRTEKVRVSKKKSTKK